jgi:hypothetical protein
VALACSDRDVGVMADIPNLAPPVPLGAALAHPDAQIRRAALRGVRLDLLEHTRDQPDTESVLAGFREDPDAYVRALAVSASER